MFKTKSYQSGEGGGSTLLINRKCLSLMLNPFYVTVVDCLESDSHEPIIDQ